MTQQAQRRGPSLWQESPSPEKSHLKSESITITTLDHRITPGWRGGSPFQWQGNPLPSRGLGSPLFGCCSPETHHSLSSLILSSLHWQSKHKAEEDKVLHLFEYQSCECVYLVEIWHQHAVCLRFVLTKNLFHLKHCQNHFMVIILTLSCHHSWPWSSYSQWSSS